MSWWDETQRFELTGEEVRCVWSSAARYAMGRGTFASRAVANAIRRNISQIDTGTLDVIARDIDWEMDREPGCVCKYFRDLPGEIRKEIDERSHDEE